MSDNTVLWKSKCDCCGELMTVRVKDYPFNYTITYFKLPELDSEGHYRLLTVLVFYGHDHVTPVKKMAKANKMSYEKLLSYQVG